MVKFEKRIIDPILKCIKKNQIFLTQKENLPQLAKLGYMYNTLWYAGRHASYEKAIEKNQCDDNPKYKIEICDPEDETIEDYIYDAWGMHVSNDFGPDWEEFSTIVLKGMELTPNEVKMLKPNKTFDEWVEILTDKDYRYSSVYPDRKSVANHMLCVIGNGYGYKNGFVINEASGADQDSTDYGDWMNAEFRPDIQKIVDKIMADPDVEKVIRVTEESAKKHKAEKEAQDIKLWGMPFNDYLKSDKYKEMKKAIAELEGNSNDEIEKYKPYYPICNYSIITMLDKNSDPSYINAAVDICVEIVLNENEESKSNVSFANKFLTKVSRRNFDDECNTEPITNLDEKIMQLKSSFSVEGIPLIKSNRFTQEEYDAMKEKSNAHKPYWNHLGFNKKVWSDEEIGQQITTLIQQMPMTEHKLNIFMTNFYKAIKYENYEEDFNNLKTLLYGVLGWDKLTPLNSDFWTNFGSAPCSMVHNHKNIGEIEQGYGAVGMDDIFGDSFETSYHLSYSVPNILHSFKDNWYHEKLNKNE